MTVGRFLEYSASICWKIRRPPGSLSVPMLSIHAIRGSMDLVMIWKFFVAAALICGMNVCAVDKNDL